MDISIAALTKYEDGTLLVQVALLGDGASCAPGEAYHPFGFIGRPKDPEVDPQNGTIINGGRAFYWFEGSTMHAWLGDDPRRTQKLPEVQKGGSMWYADADGAFARYSADGTLEVRASAGKTITLQVGAGPTIVLNDAGIQVGGQFPFAMSAGVLTALAAIQTWVAAWQAQALINAPLEAAAMASFTTALATALLTAGPAAIPSKIAVGS